MNVAAFLIPSSLEAKQALRLRHLGLAALAYAMTMALVAVGWAFGALSSSSALEIGAAYLAINAGLYAAIRSGFNLRFADPTLTRFQIVAGITVVMYIVYRMDEGREIALIGCFLVYLFGVFRLSAREFAGITLYTLAAYALVIGLSMHEAPPTLRGVHREWLSWLLLAGFLPCFTIIGGQINALRLRLRESEGRFRSLTQMSSDFYWESDARHRLTLRSSASPDWSSTSVAAFRQSTQMGQCRWDVPSLSPDEAGWLAHRVTLDRHEPFRRFVYSRAGNDGTERYVSLSGDPVFDAAGMFKGYRGVGTDVTDRRRVEKEQRESAEKLRIVAENIPVMIVSWDENLLCRFANKTFTEFFGLAIENVIGRHVREIFGEETYREVESHFAQVLRGYPVTYQGMRLRPGESRHVEVKLIPHVGELGQILGCFSVAADITEHKLTEERIQRAAHHDSLTGLPNRVLFDDRLEQAIGLAKRNSRPCALLYLDLDRFKPVNDTLGHAAGDELLKEVAARIRRQVRESDTVARMGGDEFTVILHDIGGREDAEAVATQITAALATPFEIGSAKHRVEIGSSIGIAVYPEDAQGADALVTAADAAMYGAKQAGRTHLEAGAGGLSLALNPRAA